MKHAKKQQPRRSVTLAAAAAHTQTRNFSTHDQAKTNANANSKLGLYNVNWIHQHADLVTQIFLLSNEKRE
jgi:hypothetical protein